MAELALIHQRDELLYPDIVFNRPISGLSRLQLALFGGSKKRLNTLSQLYGTTVAMGVSPVCLVEARATDASLLPLGSMLLSAGRKTGHIEQTGEVLDFLTHANLVVMAPDVEFGSSMQILFEKIWSTTAVPLVVTDEALALYNFMPQVSWMRPNTLLYLGSEALMKLAGALDLSVKIRPGRGVYNVINIAQSVSKRLRAHVICYGADMAVVVDTSHASEVGIIHFRPTVINEYRGLFMGLLCGLLADFAVELSDVLPKALTAGYLFNTITLAERELRDPVQADRLIRETIQREMN